MNVENPTKWFLNITSDKMSQDLTRANLTKTGRIYQKFNERKQEWENTKEHGKNMKKETN